MRIFVMVSICFDIIKLWNHSLLVRGHGLWHDELYLRRYDHNHGKYSDSELMVDVINNLGLNILMVHNKDNDNNIAFSPYGAGVILIALGEGLQGEALYEIRRSLQLPYDGHTIRVGLRDIHRHLKSYFIPREGFLAGITLNTDNVVIKPKYIELLRFYGYDIKSFNTALYPETHTTTTEITTTIIREETTTTTDDKSDPTTSMEITSHVTTTNPERKEENTTAITMTTSELQITVSTSSGGEKTTVSPEAPILTTENVETTVTQSFSTSDSPEITTSPPQPSTIAEIESYPTSGDITTSPPQPNTMAETENFSISKPPEITTLPSRLPQLSTNTETESYSPSESPYISTSPSQPNTNAETESFSTSESPYVSTSPSQPSTNAETESFSTSRSPDITTFPPQPNTMAETESFSKSKIPEKTTSPSQSSTNAETQSFSTSGSEDITTSPLQPNKITETENSSTFESPEITTSPPQPSTDNIITSSTITAAVNQSSTTSNQENVIITSPMPDISEMTTLMLQQTENPDSMEPIINITEKSETTTVVSQQSTNNDPESIITSTKESEITDTTIIPSTIDSTEVTLTTQASVTKPSLSEAGTLDVFSSGNRNNISFIVNNQTFLLPRPRSEMPNFSVNVRTTTDVPDEDFDTTENIQSRKIRSIKYDTMDSLNIEDMKKLRYTTYPNSNDEIGRSTALTTKENRALDIENYEIQINNTICITENHNNLELESGKVLKQSSMGKTSKIHNRHIRKLRSVEDYILARQYDQPYHFRPAKPYLPQEPPYFLVDGKKESNLDFMTYDTVLPFLYVQHLGALALAFPLDSDKYYLLLLLPLRNNGLDELVCNIRMQNIFKYILNNLELTHVKATIPSFNLKGRISLTNTLQKLGIRKIFEPRQADFSPMTDDENIYVTNIEQAVSVTIKNYMHLHKSQRHGSHYYHRDPIRFDINRPFLYFVIDSEQQVILMAGKVVNPLNVRIK